MFKWADFCGACVCVCPPQAPITEGRRAQKAPCARRLCWRALGDDIASLSSAILAPFKVGGVFPARVFAGPCGAETGAAAESRQERL